MILYPSITQSFCGEGDLMAATSGESSKISGEYISYLFFFLGGGDEG
jgi:hypothetical protein